MMMTVTERHGRRRTLDDVQRRVPLAIGILIGAHARITLEIDQST